jgi:benzoylformate decarboxylase
MSAGDVHEVLGELFPANGILVSETMNAAATMWRRVKFRQPGSFFFAAGGGLGFGLPGAVGAQLAQPERPVLCLTGDGGAQYGIQALWTAARYGIPVTILILDNQEYGILKGFGSFLRTDKVPGLNLGGLDYQAICAGYGVEVRRADDRAALSSALTRAFTDRRGPAVIVARIAAGGEDIGWHAE